MGILDVLELFDRPRNALATGVNAWLDPNEELLSGLYQGIAGQKHTSWGDVLGIPETSPEDDWAEWLLKGVARLGTDIVGDPLNLLAGTGAITKGLRLSKDGVSALGRIANTAGAGKLATAWANSPWFQLVGHEVPENARAVGEMLPSGVARELKGGDLERLIAENMRLGRTSDLDEAAKLAYRQANPLYKAGTDPLDLFTAIESKNIPEQMQGAAQAIEPLRESGLKSANNITALLEKLGLKNRWAQPFEEMEQAYLPHMQTKAGQRAEGNRLGDIRYETEVSGPGREIMNWVDESRTGVTIGKLGDTRTGISVKRAADGTETYWYKGEEVSPKSALLEQKVAEYPSIPFVTDPVAASYTTAKTRKEMENFLNLLSDLKDQGMVRQLGAGGEGYQLATGSIGDWRQIRLPGFEQYEAPKWAATRLENLGTGHFGGGQPLSRNWLEDLSQRMADSQAGQTLGEATLWFKHNVLPWPGWVAGNLGSNVVGLQQSGVNPRRMADAIAVQAGKAGEVTPGLANAQFWKEMVDRNVVNSGMTGTELGNPLQQALEGTGKVRGAVESLSDRATTAGMPTTASAIDLAGGAAATVGETIGKYNKGFMQYVGAPVENNARLAAAIDYVKKNAPDFAHLAPDEQALILDRAAQFAKDAMIDYSALSPFERNISKALPFYAWTRGITGRTADLATSNPSALADTERIMNFLFDPLGEHEKAVADPWIQEQGPVKAGWLGDVLGNGGDNQMLLSGRYLPQGNIEQMIKRPMDFMMANVSPFLKAPYELLANRNTFKDRPIDRLSGGFPGNVTNPVTGGDYELAGNTKFGYELPAGLDYLLQQSPIGRGVNTFSDLGRQAGLWEDPYKGEGSVWEGLAYAGTGGKIMPFDTARYEKKRQNEQMKRVNDIKFLLKLATQKGDQAGMDLYQSELTRAMSPLFLESP